jgi:serine/threonine-protein kinase HipA
MEVTVNIFGQRVGTLYEDRGVIRFEYEQTFINLGLNISPLKLPFEITTYVNYDDRYFETLAGVFFDSLPDKFGTKVVKRYYESKNMQRRELSALQKLVFIGKRGMGALEYEPSEKVLSDRELTESLEIRSMYESSRKIINGEPTEAIKEMLLFTDSGASAGGARAKAVVGWNKESDKIISGTGELPEGFEYWLIKFDGYDDNKQPLDFTKLEFLYMNMAKECGIDVPQLDFLTDEDLTHFAIKRFDRVGGKKIHMHSLASLVHVNFNIPMHYSYDEALRVVRFVTKDTTAVEEFYRRAVFNIVARNQDDHAKNTSFLMNSTGEWSLSPAYDITYANGEGFTKQHQMSILGKVDNFTRKDLLQLAKNNDIKNAKATAIIDKAISVISSFYSKAKDLGIREDLIELVSGDLRIRL